MITGDQPRTARAIALDLGILSRKDQKAQARLCSDLHAADGELKSEDEIDELVAHTSAWARALPSDKVTIVESLQRMGHTAAMTGDGVNDAPALKKSDIGTGMGISGSEVAKGAADIVLLDDEFSTIVAAIEEGRRTYANIQMFVCYYVTVVLGELITYALSLLLKQPMPLDGIQILFLNGLGHMLPPLSLAVQPATDDLMHLAPRRKDGKLLIPPVVRWLVLPLSLLFATAWICTPLPPTTCTWASS